MTDPLVLTAVITDQTVEVTVPALPSIDVTTVSSPFTVVTVEGPAGAAGPPGDGVFVARETPTGLIDGSNTVFTLAQNFQSGTTSVFLNGLLEFFCNELAPNQIQFQSPPQPGDAIRVSYTVSS